MVAAEGAATRQGFSSQVSIRQKRELRGTIDPRP
jgi:hypothetical protein